MGSETRQSTARTLELPGPWAVPSASRGKRRLTKWQIVRHLPQGSVASNQDSACDPKRNARSYHSGVVRGGMT